MLRLLLSLLVLALASGPAWANPASQNISAKEMRCLALNVYFEARGEPTQGQLAVALVSMNRVKSTRFPNTVCGVVWQPRQFSWTHDGKSDQPTDKRAWSTARKIANFVYTNYQNLPSRVRHALDITRGALHYYAPDLANPYWVKNQEVTRAIGGHVFLRNRS